MGIIKLEDYLEMVKEERGTFFIQPYDLTYQCFEKLGYDKMTPDYFCQNASAVVESLRKECWEDFRKTEEAFTSSMLKKLIDKDIIRGMDAEEAITWFAETYPNHIYQLNLSNTQSRRSRAGKEFEAIIELILLGANISIDSQGNIGKAHFVQRGLGKLVDAVSPGVIEFVENKRNTVLISAKTTLRERWQEVPEEMGRTGASEMFLATLDENISQEVFDTLYEANIQVTTTRRIKEEHYKSNNRVLTFEDLIAICIENRRRWENFEYSVEQRSSIVDLLGKQIVKHEEHQFVKKSFEDRLNAYIANAADQK